ncbi:MAG TPA: DUF5683 domain-containing protein [Bacteroidales bacterium]|nr:DUF5683 domain-containing protein [Bacteroidales bacterium]HPT13012.1 DUF5683 domain-containing protein [Bacteroidales bacterium]
MKHVLNITVVLLLLCASVSNAGAQDSIPRTAQKLKSHVLKPSKASMYAAVVPGLGQIYTHKYWKVPFVYAGFGTLGYFVAFNTSHYNKFMNAYRDFTDKNPATDRYIKVLQSVMDPKDYDPVLYPNSYNASNAAWAKQQLENGVTYYRRYRDLSYIGIAAWYLVTILDANVDASLFDYNMGSDLKASIAPLTVTSMGPAPGVTFTLVKTF